MLTRIKRLCVLTIAVLALSLFAGLPAASARQVDAASGATVQTPSVASSPARAAYTVAPSCIYRFSHTHLFNKHVHLQNNCSANTYVKVVIAYGPDSGCIYLPRGATATHSWSYGWPYAASRLDRVELC
jgi:hypothetical protein